MFKINVGLNRKLTRDFNSTGFSLNLEGELCGDLSDPQTLIERIKEYYDLAEEALSQQIERYSGESAIAGRDEPSPQPNNGRTQTEAAQAHRRNDPLKGPASSGQSAGNPSGQGETATNKQVQYLLNLGKRHGLTPPKLEGRIEAILGQKVGVYDLTKRQAGDVIDALNQNGEPASAGNGRKT